MKEIKTFFAPLIDVRYGATLGDSTDKIGYGPTRQAAKEDLMKQLEEVLSKDEIEALKELKSVDNVVGFP
jgi:hypothetical protein